MEDIVDKDFLKEQLNCLRNEMTHLWGSTFLFGGGAFSIIYNNPSFWGYFWGGLGMLIAILLFHAYFIRRTETLKIVNKLKEYK